MQSNIKHIKLSEVADVIDSLHQTPKYCNKGIPMVRVTDVRAGDLDLTNCLMVSAEDYEKYSVKHKPQIGDIIISRVGSYGIFSYVASSKAFCLGQNTAIISPKINSRYLYYVLSSFFVRQQIEQMVVGSTQKTISLKNIKDLQIPLFDEKEQDKIAQILESIDKKIAVNKQINDNLQQQAKALYEEMFINNCDANTTSGTLSDIAIITMGQSPSGSSYNEDSIGEVFYQGRAEFGFRFPTRRLFTTEPKRMAEAGDVLLSVRAPVGDLNVAYERCCIGRGLGAIHSKYGNSSFVLYTVFALRPQLDVFNGEGTVFGSINRDALNSMPIEIPSTDKIAQFEAVVRPMDELIRTNYEEICRLEALRDSLLPKLMSGEIDVSDIQI